MNLPVHDDLNEAFGIAIATVASLVIWTIIGVIIWMV